MSNDVIAILTLLSSIGVGGFIRWLYVEAKSNYKTSIENAHKAGEESARAEAYKAKSEEVIAAKNREIESKDALLFDAAERLKRYETVEEPRLFQKIDQLRNISESQQGTINSQQQTIESQRQSIQEFAAKAASE